jgi:hypothetical protein
LRLEKELEKNMITMKDDVQNNLKLSEEMYEKPKNICNFGGDFKTIQSNLQWKNIIL